MSILQNYPGLAQARGGAFYLYGQDEFRKNEVARALVDAHLDPATRDFNLDPLRGDEVDTETLASILGTPPMMAEFRVVHLRGVEGLASSARSRKILLDAVVDPPPGLALIMVGTVPSGSRAKFYRDLAKGARSLEFKAVTPADVPGWLMARVRKRHGIEMDVEAAQALGAAVGVNLGILAMELEKLANFAGARGRITCADVEAAGTRLPSQDRWRWFDLVGGRRFADARSSLGVLWSQGENGVGLTIGLTTHLLRLGIVVEQGPRALEGVLPPHQKWLANRLVGQARGWTLDDLEHALGSLLRVDRLLKASPLGGEHLLEEWLLALMVRERAAA